VHAGPFAARIRACKRTSRGGPDDADAVRFVEETTFAGPDGRTNLTLLFRADDGFADRLLGLLEQLSHTGFGAGVSSGWGQFDLPEDPRPADELDEPPAGVNGVIALSTFQPAPDDPATGDWDAFVKEPRVGPEGGLGGEAGRKRPVVLFRPPPGLVLRRRRNGSSWAERYRCMRFSARRPRGNSERGASNSHIRHSLYGIRDNVWSDGAVAVRNEAQQGGAASNPRAIRQRNKKGAARKRTAP